ncbi:MAG: hypothetical protein AB7G13_11770 [Lautropia sp.]
MRVEELDRVEARLQAAITVIERDPAASRRAAAQLRRLRGLRWATRIVRARLLRQSVAVGIARLGWRSQVA